MRSRTDHLPAARQVAASVSEDWILEWRCRVVLVTTLVLSLGMCTIVVRGCLIPERHFPWCDLIGVLLLTAVAWLIKQRRQWLRPLTWVVLAFIFIDVADGLLPWPQQPITPTHLLLPALILYGAVLGDLAISMVTAGGVLLIYGLTWWFCRPLSSLDLERITNLMAVTVCSSLLAVGVWIQYRRFIATLRRQASDLRNQLDANQRLNAVISHDISNPLSALLATVELARIEGRIGPEELATVERMAGRIANIVDSVRQINADTGHQMQRAEVRVQALANELAEIFSHRLAEKQQSLVLHEGGTLHVATDAKVLCCSVLGNLLSNAIKFSPRGATITMTARVEADRVRLELHNPGGGFPPEVLRQVAEGHSPGSRPGTESETGAGYGLRIARFYLQRMGGLLDAANEPGGAVVSVLLPGKARG